VRFYLKNKLKAKELGHGSSSRVLAKHEALSSSTSTATTTNNNNNNNNWGCDHKKGSQHGINSPPSSGYQLPGQQPASESN
jgi:hypothetical protein